MDALRRATDSVGVRSLIDTFFDVDEVQGFAVDVHERFVTLYRNEFGSQVSINDMLDSGLIPSDWTKECKNAGFSITLSPIYVVMYITGSILDFMSSHPNIPAVVSPGHAVYVESQDPMVGQAPRRYRPVKGGISVGNARSTFSGTIGGFIRDKANQDAFLLTCSHVLEDHRHRDVIQPGASDGGSNHNDIIGALSYAARPAPIVKGTLASSAPLNTADAAIARIDPSVGIIPILGSFGTITQALTSSALAIDDLVDFCGKESHHQVARISRFITQTKVIIGGAKYRFGNIFEIVPTRTMYLGSLSRPGDSGSWVVKANLKGKYDLCGILFAGNGKMAYCCFIEEVMSELERVSSKRFTLY